MLKNQLCRYYEERNAEDIDRLPRVTRRNVLVLKYYSFENYFLNPLVMEKLGIIKSEEAFYETLFEKWKEYLHRMKSGKKLLEILGKDLLTIQDIKSHMEEIKIYMRGHNLYDIFYGKYKGNEEEILKRYIDLAPREADTQCRLDGWRNLLDLLLTYANKVHIMIILTYANKGVGECQEQGKKSES